MLADSLVHIGMAVLSLGTIHEADGTQERPFLLYNAGGSDITLVQGYTSCGCTTLLFDKDVTLSPGDTTCVTLKFNPQGKEGEFYESGTVVYENGHGRRRIQIAMEGDCIASEETLMRRFPVRVSDNLRLSADRFDVGIINTGASRQLSVVVLHRDDANRQELIPITFTAAPELGKGLHHVKHPVTVTGKDGEHSFTITVDVIIR